MKHIYNPTYAAFPQRLTTKAQGTAAVSKIFMTLLIGFFLLVSGKSFGQNEDMIPYNNNFNQSSDFSTALRSDGSLNIVNSQLRITGGTGQNDSYEGYVMINNRKFDIKAGYTYIVSFDAVAYDNAQASAGVVQLFANSTGVSNNNFIGAPFGGSVTVAKGVATNLVRYTIQFVAPSSSVEQQFLALKLTSAQRGNNSALTIDNLSITGSCAPTAPIAIGSGSCTPTSLDLKAEGASGTERYQWYDENQNPISTAITANYRTEHLTRSTTFYVAKVSSLGCASQKVAVLARIGNPIPPTVTSDAKCVNGNQTITFTASGAGLNETYRWYTAAGALVTEGATFVRQTNKEYGDYYVVIAGSGSCQARTDINVPDNNPNPSNPTAMSINQCGNGSVKIEPIVEPGMSYIWYSAAGDYLGEGTSYITPEFIAGTAPVNYVYNIRKVNIATRCESNATAQVTITVTPIPEVSAIMGQAAVCQGTTGVTYRVPAISGATYSWVLTPDAGSSGATITAGAGTSQITVNYPTSTYRGRISVTVSNICNTYTSNLSVQASGNNTATGNIIEPDNLEIDKLAVFKFMTNVPEAEIEAIQWFKNETGSTSWIKGPTSRDWTIDQMPGNIDGFRVAIRVRNPSVACFTSLGNLGIEGFEANSFYIDDLPITPLPVELVSFKAQRHTKGVNLTWATASELENKGFEVQVSTNARDFTAIGFVESKVGTTSLRQDYNFLDTKAVSGTRYYRLKQVDFDGTTSFSPIRAVTLNAENATASAYPNPFDDAVVVTLNGTEARNVQVVLVDAMGKVLQQRTEETSGNSITVDMRGITTKGMYVLYVLDNNTKHTFKLMKR
ncbi:Ig-like domain-containing protein [Pontibacter ramchanderi]|uniref:Putative secreted protein (Por secretion system target) n=1 Tax=Pontibacter ramchanderi TaxID=1179743 RepID=A0A2N3UD21_9BACT|nr:T9SS type A sorting domain-containing protein [Pontibacter ramchanderi]PKV67266.1 putative secreted protein (Por secretion system target) [Pontibacter ramchanderi]